MLFRSYTYSVFVKPISHLNRQFILRGVFANGSNSAFLTFDLSTGTLTSNNGGLWTNATISSSGNGWYLIRATFQTPSTIPLGNDLIFRMQHFEATPQANIYAGISTIGTGFWGMQLQPGSIALGYTPTNAYPQTTIPDGFINT